MTDGLCDAPGETGEGPCGKLASRWGMDLDMKPVELCKPCWFYYTIMVEEHKMPQPRLKCHTCGKEIILEVSEASRVMEMLHNPVVSSDGRKLRDKDPIFMCLSCKEPRPLGWATVGDHCRVLFNWFFTEPAKEVVTNA